MNVKTKLKEAVQRSRQYVGGGAGFIRLRIPSYKDLSAAEQAAVDAGEPWPVWVENTELSPGVAKVIEFLSDSAVEAGRLDHLQSEEAAS